MSEKRGLAQHGWLCSLLAIVFPVVASAIARGDGSHKQPLPQVRPPVFMFMLANELVRTELGLSAAQRKQVQALHADFVATSPKGQPSPSSDDSTRDRDSLIAQLKASAIRFEKLEARALSILTPKQVARLEQLRLQAKGVFALLEPSVQETLGLSEEVVAKTRQLIGRGEKQCQECVAQVRARKLTVSESVMRVDRIRERVHHDAFSLLDDAQQLRLKKILGEKPSFDPAKIRFRITAKSNAT